MKPAAFLNRVRASCLLLAALVSACGAERRPIVPGVMDLAVAPDLAAPPPDFARLPDLAPPPDLTPEPDPEPDLLPGECTIVGLWDVGIGNLLTIGPRGNFDFEFGPNGQYKVAGDRFTVVDDFSADCAMPGLYRFTFSAQCSRATMRVISDPCTDRIKVFEMQDWVRQ